MGKDNNISDELGIYEIGLHVIPTVPEDKVQEVVLKLENLISENKGSILSQEFPKMVNLAYEIRKRMETKYLNFNKAYFGWIKFEIPRDSVEKIEEGVKNNENVLRFIIVKTVRENTMHVPRISSMKNSREEKVYKNKVERKEKEKISEEELDKSIEELVIS